MNKINMTNKINYKYCSNKINKQFKTLKIDHINEINDYCWNCCYLKNNTVAAKLAVQTVW